MKATVTPNPEPEVVLLLPPANLAGRPAPLADIHANLERGLREAGIPLAAHDSVEEFLQRHRVRYTAGISGELAAAARDELGATSILIATVEAWSSQSSPGVGIGLRLVSAEDPPRLLWARSLGRSGDQDPGLFERGVERDIGRVQAGVIATLSRALADHLAGRPQLTDCAGERRFSPETVFVSPDFGVDRTYTVAVMPFVNDTHRRSAGEVLAFEFVRRMQQRPERFVVQEPGVLREELLRYRIAVDGGISLDTARVVLELADADLVVTGIVRRWEETAGVPVVEFTAYALERRDNSIAWQASSWATGDEGVFFFDAGRIGNTRELACRMVSAVVDRVSAASSRGK